MNRLSTLHLAGLLMCLLAPTPGCGSDSGSPGGVPDGTGGTGADDGGDGGEGGQIMMPDGGGGSGGDGDDADLCASTQCPMDQHCEVVSGAGSCVPNDCATLQCTSPQICEVTDAGAYCKENSCTSDVNCAPSQFCNGTTCEDDVCAPGDRRCSGNGVVECTPNGGGETHKFVCASSAADFDSTCQDLGGGAAGCTCRDDWDCPTHTSCTGGLCEGTGVKPTCSLPPEPFLNVLPTPEIVWGGTQANPKAVGSPFENSTQVVLTPVVANLDDDNGDGLIDERDFPEIIFTTFCNSDFQTNGVLRAIHGGGPNKGKDFFASCGDQTWHEGQALDAVSCTCGEAVVDSTAGLAVGDLDNDGVPEIVAISEPDATTNGSVRIYDNTGGLIAESAGFTHGGANPAPAIANVDNAGNAEIIVGRSLFTLGKDANGKLIFLDRFAGSADHGANGQGPVPCVANLVGDSRLEIVAGSSLYRFPQAPPGAVRRSDCTGAETDADHIAWCAGQLPLVWDSAGVNEGFCAVADILGADQAAAPGPANPLDGVPEVILIRSGRLYVLNSQDGTVQRNILLATGDTGGAPNVDDFDGDGFPEVGTAGGTAYMMVDLQDPTASCPAWPNPGNNNTTIPRTPPAISCVQHADCGDAAQFGCNAVTGACVCLHNGWRRTTEDDSSRVTGSSVFDFNGDGAAEVIYNDECFFRVYDGTEGTVLFQEHSESRTRIEYPIVADVDNDGNAEIVFATSTESGFCGGDGGDPAIQAQYNAGIEVWGDSSDLWVSARRIWNQHAYHVTNVTEGGQIPAFEPDSWKQYNGRIYNTYRSNPRAYGVAPDLSAQAVQVSSPDAACGQLSDKLDITVQIANIGDLRVGPGVAVSFHGTWSSVPLTEPLNDSSGSPLIATIQSSLEPGQVILLTVSYDAASNAPLVLPDSVRVVVDDGDQARECNETNNELEQDVEPGLDLPDLRIVLGTIDPLTCPSPKVTTTIHNDGSAPASNIDVRYYAGDPSAAGTVIHQVTRPGPLAPGGSDTFAAALLNYPENLNLQVWGVVDPDNTIVECNDGNNKDSADNKVICGGVH